MNEKTYSVSLRFDLTAVIGVLKVQGIGEYDLAKSVLVPSVMIHEDGSVEVMDFSIIPNDQFKAVDIDAKIKEVTERKP